MNRFVVPTFQKAILVVLGVLAFLSLTPQVVQAHAVLDSSTPAVSSVISATPADISLRFSEDVESSLASIRLFNAEKTEISIGPAQRDPADFTHVFAEVATRGTQLPSGTYVVVWRAVSTDGHPVSGAFPFEIAEQSTGNGLQVLADVLEGMNSQSPLATPLASTRYLGYLGAFVLIGFIVFTWTLQQVNMRQIRMAQGATILLLLGSVSTLLFQGPYVAGKTWGDITNFSLLSDVVDTRLGLALIIRIICGVVWGVLLMSFAHRETSWWKNIAFLCSVVTIISFAAAGHASAGTWPLFYVAVQAIHLAALSIWAGGLLVMAVTADNHDESTIRYSRLATWAMPVTVLTGVVQGLHLMGGVGSATSTTFGKLLILKSVLVACVIVFGVVARRRLMNSSTSFANIVRFEAVLVVLVFAVTSFMVGKTPTATEGVASTTFTTTQLQDDVLASIEIAPTKVGTIAVHVILSPPGGALSPVKSVVVQMSLTSKNIPAVPVKMMSIGPNHWSGIVQIPFSGTWEMEARVKPTDTETLLYSTQVNIKD